MAEAEPLAAETQAAKRKANKMTPPAATPPAAGAPAAKASANRGVSERKAYALGSSGACLVVSSGSVVNFVGDAIVNAANEGCLGGGGVDGAITQAGGRALAAAREALPELESGVRCRTGDAKLTVGGDLKASYCIHAVGPNYMFGNSLEESDAQLRGAYTAAMSCAREQQLATVAFSLISAGIFRGSRSLTEVLSIGVEAIQASAYEGLQEVHLVGFQDREIAELTDICDARLAPAPAPTPAEPAAAPAAADDWEGLKAEGTKLYMADDFNGAIEKYSAAISAYEAKFGEEPTDTASCKALSVLLTNRAMASLQIVRKDREKQRCPPGKPLPAELRPLVMRANVDASRAVDLDEDYAKAWFRKGQALCWMSSMQQRAKESVRALEKARDLPSLPKSMLPEVKQWLAVAKHAYDDQTPMPEGCCLM
eukprot:TRINITY_DN33325_c0_g1_i1.p1 TRINITY_DN33325_c0_g1~~TRINITY_DN33325_c0_g1_i1.p1  ORF type:complete len:447 (+),score=136.78 TRINITY_DN33325_c0_g1_i1:66-1343(+)